MPYRLRFFFDTGSGICLWAGDPATEARYGLAVDPQTLPLPPELVAEAERLIALWDTGIDWNDPGGSSPWTAEDTRRFQAQAEALLDRLRVALGPGFMVVDERQRA
ncbi:hypothetical protein [Deinococcus multiflagellatus]|uniref:hypothetical protein n=1 Tax=Deinococcus multiflagellatus TaxID=1656887 RepID=UPI001CCFAF33|nr:hypothetical protein [Deinococcus multiflagellatus]MBZ9713386.1 hypothetical protein [Deinococcus multiflagellatus]